MQRSNGATLTKRTIMSEINIDGIRDKIVNRLIREGIDDFRIKPETAEHRRQNAIVLADRLTRRNAGAIFRACFEDCGQIKISSIKTERHPKLIRNAIARSVKNKKGYLESLDELYAAHTISLAKACKLIWRDKIADDIYAKYFRELRAKDITFYKTDDYDEIVEAHRLTLDDGASLNGSRVNSCSCMDLRSNNEDAIKGFAAFYTSVKGFKMLILKDQGEIVGRAEIWKNSDDEEVYGKIYCLRPYQPAALEFLADKIVGCEGYHSICMPFDIGNNSVRIPYMDVTIGFDYGNYSAIVTNPDWCPRNTNTFEIDVDRCNLAAMIDSHGDENTVRCEQCGECFDPEDDGEYIDERCFCCPSCAQDAGYSYCSHCHEWYAAEKMVECNSDARHFCCEGCANAEGYYECETCGKYEHRDNCTYADDYTYCCDECAEEGGNFFCENCGEWKAVSDNRPLEINVYKYCNEGCAEQDGWKKCTVCGNWERHIENCDNFICASCEEDKE